MGNQKEKVYFKENQILNTHNGRSTRRSENRYQPLLEIDRYLWFGNYGQVDQDEGSHYWYAWSRCRDCQELDPCWSQASRHLRSHSGLHRRPWIQLLHRRG